MLADEANFADCSLGLRHIWLFDVREPTNPVSFTTIPVPSEADYCAKGGNFGPHNLWAPLGAATAGLVANASGLDNGLDPGSVLRASLWVPLGLVAAPLAACAIGVRLNLMVPRSRERGLTAARNG